MFRFFNIVANTHIPAPKLKQLAITNLKLALTEDMYAQKVK